MNFASIRVITSDAARLVAFYEQVTGVEAVWANDDFAEIDLNGFTLAIGSVRTVALFAAGSAEPAANRSVIVEFAVSDVDAYFAGLEGTVDDIVIEPTTMPWGNRSVLFRDPDGNLVNIFTPGRPQPGARE